MIYPSSQPDFKCFRDLRAGKALGSKLLPRAGRAWGGLCLWMRLSVPMAARKEWGPTCGGLMLQARKSINWLAVLCCEAVLEMEPRVLHMLDEHATTELLLRPFFSFIL